MRFRTLGAAILNTEVVILAVSTVAAVAAVFAWTGTTVVGGAIAMTVVILAVAAVALKVYTIHAQGDARRKIVDLMAAGTEVLRVSVMESPGGPSRPETAPSPRHEDVTNVEVWIASAKSFVAQNHPEFLARFESNANLFTPDYVGKHYEFEKLRDRIEFRLARLAELMRQL